MRKLTVLVLALASCQPSTYRFTYQPVLPLPRVTKDGRDFSSSLIGYNKKKSLKYLYKHRQKEPKR